MEAGLCRSGRTGGAVWGEAVGSRNAAEPLRSLRWAALGSQEGLAGDTAHSVMVETPPVAIPEVVQTELVLEFLVVGRYGDIGRRFRGRMQGPVSVFIPTRPRHAPRGP